MERIDTDVLIAGGGAAGLTATLAFARLGLSTLCVDPAPVADLPEADRDLRSTALLMPSLDLLDEIGAMDRIAPLGTPLRVMRLADAGGAENRIRTTADFRAEDVGQAKFGDNVLNHPLRTALTELVAAAPGATLLAPAAVVRVTPRLNDVVVGLSTGQQVRAKLLIAADGRESAVRTALGIAAPRWSYGQRAMVFAVRHAAPHENISTEIHRTGGPFTLVPLPDRDRAPHSAVVWMETGPEVARLMALDPSEFSLEATARSCGVLGPLTLVSRRAAWPIISQLAARLDGPRTALVAEAAHVMPPIGAQGLNTSLADIRALRDLVSAAITRGEDIAAPALLTRYHRARHGAAALRVGGVDALNRAAMALPQPVRDLRRLGLEALHRIRPLRHGAMRLGLGG